MSDWNSVVLQAYVDGEATPEEVAAVERAMAREPEVAARVALLRAVGGAIEDGLGAAFGAAPPELAQGASADRGRWFGLVLVAAAALIVFAVWRARRDPDPMAADQRVENPFFSVRCVPRHGGTWDLFSAAAVELDWACRSGDGAEAGWRVHVIETGTPARDAIPAEQDGRAVPVRLSARIEGPGGATWDAEWRGEPLAITGVHRQVLPLSALQIDDSGLAPMVCVEPTETGWSPDPNWGLRHLGTGPGLQRFVPQEPGEYRLVVRLDSVPVEEGRAWQTFAEPLEVESTLRVSATVGEWSETVDGIRARLVAPRAHMRGKGVFPLVLQLRNDSDRVRRYNVVGVTQVEVPQPFHFNLIVDGEEWDQAEAKGPMIPAGILMMEHGPGTTRSLVVPPSQWSLDGVSLADSPGDHRVQFRFHSQLLIWNANDRSIWQGEITTPGVKVSIAER